MPPKPNPSTKTLMVFGALWVVLVAAGFTILWSYKTAPGPTAAVPVRWPDYTRLKRGGKRATLMMFAHPRCGCTRASIAELAQLMVRSSDQIDAYVLFLSPAGEGKEWTRTDLWSSAARIPGVTAMSDENGREAARFGIATSGGVVLYDNEGKLLFHGGITPARGHEGDSFGRERILSLLATGKADRNDAPVFGCELQGVL